MEGIVNSYRRSYRTMNVHQCIIEIRGIETKQKAKTLVGKKVSWNSKKRNMVGTILAAHGNKGKVRARFATPLPGQALGTKVRVQ